jgi:SAM-dependent methyltransferase
MSEFKHGVTSVPDISGKLMSGRVYPEIFPLPLDSRVVNLGCGNGPQTVIYGDRFREMIGIDVNEDRIARSIEIAEGLGISGYSGKVGDVENTGLANDSMDVALAIDVIEHVQSPESMLAEAHRILRPGGQLLITYPVMHDHFVHTARAAARIIRRRKAPAHDHSVWNPDAHNQANSVGDWVHLTEAAGFEKRASRATTMFPPLHVFGVPRFWFSVGWIHAIDSRLSRLPGLRRLGQSLVCVYENRP